MDRVTKLQARIEEFADERIFSFCYPHFDGILAFINYLKDKLLPNVTYFRSFDEEMIKFKLKDQKQITIEIEKLLEVSKKAEKDLQNAIKKLKRFSSDSKDEEEVSDE